MSMIKIICNGWFQVTASNGATGWFRTMTECQIFILENNKGGKATARRPYSTSD